MRSVFIVRVRRRESPREGRCEVNAQHTQDSTEHGTPMAWKLRAAKACGVPFFDLDPACSAPFRGHAHRTFDAAGLDLPWGDASSPTRSLFLNPPGDARLWWTKLLEEIVRGRVLKAVYLAYSIEQIPASYAWTDGVYPMSAFCVAYPHEYRGRIRYEALARDVAAKKAEALRKLAAEAKTERGRDARLAKAAELEALPPDALVPGDQPTHASAFIGVGIEWDAWLEAFVPYAECTRGRWVR